MQAYKKQVPTIIAILIGGALLASAVILKEGGVSAASIAAQLQNDASAVSPLRSENRLVYGDPESDIAIVEFSDYECPFCARVHPTIEQIVNENPDTIHWEYRHMPLPSHRNAEAAAIAAECVARERGTDAFWGYTETLFTQQRNLTPTTLREAAVVMGLSESDYDDCISDERIYEQIQADVEAAVTLGGRGTPFSIIVFPDGRLKPVSGALPYAQWIAQLELN